MLTANVILTYSGRLPNYFSLYVSSCGANPSITWTLLTDRPPNLALPPNVRWVEFSLDDLKARVGDRLGVRASFTDPYKICDFKPAIGFLYPEITNGFDLWGHCDPDVIWGDVRRLIPPPGAPIPPKLQTRGAFSLYRNDEVGNNLFRLPHPRISYKEAFENPRYAMFDEWSGLWKIMVHNGIAPSDRDAEVAEIDSDHHDLRLIYSKPNRFPQVFAWDSGRLLRFFLDRDELRSDEFAYAHLQKRAFSAPGGGDWSRFAIVPGHFVPLPSLEDLTKVLHLNRRQPMRSLLLQMQRPLRRWRARKRIDRAYSLIKP